MLPLCTGQGWRGGDGCRSEGKGEAGAVLWGSVQAGLETLYG